MNGFSKKWFPKLISFVLACVFWYAVMSELGKKRDFILKEWGKFLDSKQKQNSFNEKRSA